MEHHKKERTDMNGYQELVKELAVETDSRIVFLIMDGLGGLPVSGDGKTTLELARTPNMDALVEKNTCGLADPIAPGISPGSGPAHLSLFGYDPVKYLMGRGVLEALGIDFPLKPGDIAIRVNFCTVDNDGVVTDRRAGRISTEKCAELAEKLDTIKVKGAELFVRPVKEHRAAVVIRAPGLGGNLKDTDPQVTGKKPLPLSPEDEASKKTANLANNFLEKAQDILKNEKPANMMLFRGISSFAKYPSMNEVYKVKAAAIAQYPMYRGLARLLGMDVLDVGEKLENLFDVLERVYRDYTYFFIHVKKTDSAGEDGDWARKVEVIEAVDKQVTRVTALEPECLVITGDHSTPAPLKAHSWHPLPVLLASTNCRPDQVREFNEKECIHGGLGRFLSTSLMPLAMAHALKLERFGA
jgi:2,3-bisphosphoglycerate-independent phosphoglycerate mutase